MTGDVPLGPPPAVPIEHIDDGHPGADATLVARSVENKLPIAHALDGHRHPRIRSPSNNVSAPPSSNLSGNTSSVEFEVVYYVTGNDYVVHIDAKQAMLLELYEALPDLGLTFAFPTQSLHIESMPEADVAPRASSGNGRARPEA